MPHITTTEQGGITSASAQIAETYPSQAVGAGSTANLEWLLTRGAPRIVVHVLQSAGAAGATVTVQASVSDDDAGAQQPLTIGSFIAPLNVPVAVPFSIPTKFCRVSITSPAGNAVTLSVAILAAQ